MKSFVILDLGPTFIIPAFSTHCLGLNFARLLINDVGTRSRV